MLQCMASKVKAISFSKLNFSSILHWPQLQMSVLAIDHLVSLGLGSTCTLKHVQLSWNYKHWTVPLYDSGFKTTVLQFFC